MAKKLKTWTCPECGGKVRPVARRGRAHRYGILLLEVPAGIAIETCDSCGEEYISPAVGRRIDAALAPAYRAELAQRARVAIDGIVATGIEQKRLESALGLSAGYLSKIRTGARSPSAELVSQLALVAVDPRRRLDELLAYWRTGKTGTRAA